MDSNDILQALQQLLTQQIAPIHTRLDSIDSRLETVDKRLETVDKRLDTVDKRLDVMQEDITQIKEDSAVTRSAVNSLLDWADDQSIQPIPLSSRKKAQ